MKQNYLIWNLKITYEPDLLPGLHPHTKGDVTKERDCPPAEWVRTYSEHSREGARSMENRSHVERKGRHGLSPAQPLPARRQVDFLLKGKCECSLHGLHCHWKCSVQETPTVITDPIPVWGRPGKGAWVAICDPGDLSISTASLTWTNCVSAHIPEGDSHSEKIPTGWTETFSLETLQAMKECGNLFRGVKARETCQTKSHYCAKVSFRN